MTVEDIYARLQKAYEPYRDASRDTELLSLALVKALCTEHFPTGVKVVCDITDQGGDTLVFSYVEDAAGEELDVPDVPGLEDMLSEAMMNLEYHQVENEGTRRMPEPIIRLDDEFPLPPVPPVLYEKCAGCHLFVETNDNCSSTGDGCTCGWKPSAEIVALDGQAYTDVYSAAYLSHKPIVSYIHLHRGDDADEALDRTHEPRPSGQLANLDTWKVFGPSEMRARFTDTPALIVLPEEQAVACPQCQARDSVELVDISERWNSTEAIWEDGKLVAFGINPADSDHHNDRWKCGACHTTITVPDDVDDSWP